jgi:hypothetical protein
MYRSMIPASVCVLHACVYSMQARIGGIVANNASGMCCGVAGNSYHTMHSIRVILSDGTVLDTGDEQSKVRGWSVFLAANHFHVSASRLRRDGPPYTHPGGWAPLSLEPELSPGAHPLTPIARARRAEGVSGETG